jgi:hypothetical protein
MQFAVKHEKGTQTHYATTFIIIQELFSFFHHYDGPLILFHIREGNIKKYERGNTGMVFNIAVEKASCMVNSRIHREG